MSFVNEIDQVKFDTIIIGSSLSNCILFASLARAGKSVALFETQPMHGWLNSTMFLSDFHRLMTFLQQSDAMRKKNPRDVYNGYKFCNIADPPMLSRREIAKLQKSGPLPCNLFDVIQAYRARLIKQHTFLRSLLKTSTIATEDETQMVDAGAALLDENQTENNDIDDGSNKVLSFTTFPTDFDICKHVKLKHLTAELSSSSTYTCVPFSSFLTSSHVNNENTNDAIIEQGEINIHSTINNSSTFPLHNGYEYIPTSNLPLQQVILPSLNPLDAPKNSSFQPTSSTPDPNSNSPTIPETQATQVTPATQATQATSANINPNDLLPTNPKLDEILKRNGYRYGIDLIPQQIYATSLTVKSLIQAKFLDYFEFHAVNRMMVLFKPHHDVITEEITVEVSVEQPHDQNESLQAKSDQESNTDDERGDVNLSNENIILVDLPTPASSIIRKEITNIKNIKELMMYQPWSVPSSKNEIFADSMLSLRCKNKLSTLLLILLHDTTNAQTTQYHHDMYNAYKDLPLVNLVYHLCHPVSSSLAQISNFASSIISKHPSIHLEIITPILTIPTLEKLDRDTLILTQLVTYGLSQYLHATLSTSSTKTIPKSTESYLSTAQAYSFVKMHLRSIGRYGTSPMLYPAYGIGELAQAWIRNGCVWGGVAVHRVGLAGLVLPNKTQNVIVNAIEDIEEDTSTNAESITKDIPSIKLNDGVNDQDHIGILLQTGQIIKTKTVVIDRINSPLPLSQTVMKSYSPSPITQDSAHKPNMSESSGQVALADELAHGTTVQLPSQLESTTIPQSYRIATTQHIVLVTDKLPQHFLPQNDTDHASLQVFIVPEVVTKSGDKSLSQFITEKLTSQLSINTKTTQTKEDTQLLDISTGASKIFIADDASSLTLNNQYMIAITTNLCSTTVTASDDDNITELVNIAFTTQQDVVSQYFQHKHQKHELKDKTHPIQPSIPEILSVLPQLQPFLTLDTSTNEFNNDHIFYIASYCQTHVTPNNTPATSSPASTTNYSTTTYTDHNNIFITPDADSLAQSPEQSFTTATHTYYGLMGHFYTTLKQPVLPFLMTVREQQVAGDNGEVLERLEDRNPQLAHTINVIEDLERQLQTLDQQKEQLEQHKLQIEIACSTSAEDGTKTETEQDPTNPAIVEKIVQKASPDDKAAMLDFLDNMDLTELDNLGL